MLLCFLDFIKTLLTGNGSYDCICARCSSTFAAACMNTIRRTFATSSTWSHFTIERSGLIGRMSSGHHELLQRLPLHINLGGRHH